MYFCLKTHVPKSTEYTLLIEIITRKDKKFPNVHTLSTHGIRWYTVFKIQIRHSSLAVMVADLVQTSVPVNRRLRVHIPPNNTHEVLLAQALRKHQVYSANRIYVRKRNSRLKSVFIFLSLKLCSQLPGGSGECQCMVFQLVFCMENMCFILEK